MKRLVGWVTVVVALGACGDTEPDDGVAETTEVDETDGESSSGAGSGATDAMTSTTSATTTTTTSAATSEGEESSETSASDPTSEGGSTGPEESTGEAPVDPFSCGDDVCDGATEYCREAAFDGPSEYSCRPIPASCLEVPTCACIGPSACTDDSQGCSGEREGHIRVQCVEG